MLPEKPLYLRRHPFSHPAAGDLAGGRTAHAVGHREQERLRRRKGGRPQIVAKEGSAQPDRILVVL
ncbi:MAG: hypothetical protein ACOCYN_03480, partial [Planctomycetota bacterium]